MILTNIQNHLLVIIVPHFDLFVNKKPPHLTQIQITGQVAVAEESLSGTLLSMPAPLSCNLIIPQKRTGALNVLYTNR